MSWNCLDFCYKISICYFRGTSRCLPGCSGNLSNLVKTSRNLYGLTLQGSTRFLRYFYLYSSESIVLFVKRSLVLAPQLHISYQIISFYCKFVYKSRLSLRRNICLCGYEVEFLARKLSEIRVNLGFNLTDELEFW